VKKIDLAYLAGILDADGYFTIKRSTYSVRVKKDSHNPIFSERIGIKQVAFQAIKILHENFGGYYRVEKPSAKNGKPLHCFQVTNLKAIKLAKAVYPYLKIKKEQCKLLFDLREISKSPRIHNGTYRILKHHCGKDIKVRNLAIDPVVLAKKELLFRRIKELNDNRHYFEQFRK